MNQSVKRRAKRRRLARHHAVLRRNVYRSIGEQEKKLATRRLRGKR